MEHKQTILLAPPLGNSSCWRSGTSEATWTGPGPGELIRANVCFLFTDTAAQSWYPVRESFGDMRYQ